MNDDLSAEILERAGRDQAARMSLRPGLAMPDAMAEWESVVEPVDRDNSARLRFRCGRRRVVAPRKIR
jgi:hypothetical protein